MVTITLYAKQKKRHRCIKYGQKQKIGPSVYGGFFLQAVDKQD